MVPGLVGDEIFSVSGFQETHARRREAGDIITSSCPWHARETFREFCSGVCNVHSKLKHSKPTVGYGCFLYTQTRQQAEHMPQRNIKDKQKEILRRSTCTYDKEPPRNKLLVSVPN
jgi:hypothetical protein